MTTITRTWDHSFACGIHDDKPCTCKEDQPVTADVITFEANGKDYTAHVDPRECEPQENAMTRTADGVEYAIFITLGSGGFTARPVKS